MQQAANMTGDSQTRINAKECTPESSWSGAMPSESALEQGHPGSPSSADAAHAPLVEIGWIQRPGGEAVRGIVTREEVVGSTLLVMLRLRADIQYLAAQRNIRWRCIIRSIKLLHSPPEDQCGQARIRYGQVDRMASVPSPSRKRQLLPPLRTSFRMRDTSTPPRGQLIQTSICQIYTANPRN